MSKPKKTFGQILNGLHRHTLYGLLLVASSVPLFFTIEVPNKPDDQTMDLYVSLMQLPTNKTVLIESDWTISTRGESAGQLEALLRILMRRGIKFVIYSGADPQAPQVARDVLQRINDEREKEGERRYRRWDDYVDLGYFPNLEGFANALGINVRQALGVKKEIGPGGRRMPVFESPVLKDVHKISDIGLMVNITASGTIDVIVERLFRKVPLALMCTGVMGPQAVPYYQATPRQLVGLSVGLKGVYDLETLMQYGVRGEQVAGPPSRLVTKNFPEANIEGFPGKRNFARAGAYYPTLHVALTLMILAVVAGNIGVVLVRRAGGGK